MEARHPRKNIQIHVIVCYSILLGNLSLNKLFLVRCNHQADCTEESIATTVNELQQVLQTNKAFLSSLDNFGCIYM